jgi:hypothetical protein
MSLRSQISKMRCEILCSLHRRTAALGDLGPIVTFSFDDFPRSALTTGADIIEKCGGRATYYVSMGLMGQRNDLGEQFESADLQVLVERGPNCFLTDSITSPYGYAKLLDGSKLIHSRIASSPRFTSPRNSSSGVLRADRWLNV